MAPRAEAPGGALDPATPLGLVGRDAEVALARAVVADPASRVLLVSGPAGIGKSRLLDEVLRDPRSGPVQLRTRAHPMDEHLSLACLVPALVDHLDQLPGPRRREVLEGLDQLGDVLEGYGLQPRALPDSPHLLQTRRLEALRRLLLRLAEDPQRHRRDRRLVLVLDDAHWADRATLEVLAHLARPSGSAAVTIVVGHRPDEGSATLATTLATLRRSAGCAEVQLSHLTPDEVAQLVAHLTDGEPDPRLVRWLAERSGGLPLFVVGLVEELLRRHGDDARASLPARPSPTDRAVVPTVARDVFLPRVDAVSSRARRVLDTLAVAGSPTTLTQIARVLSEELATVGAATDELVDAGLATIEAGGLTNVVHSLVRDVVVAELGAATRRTLHAGFVADLREHFPDRLGRLAHHVRHAGPLLAPAAAFDVLERAGRQAVALRDGEAALADLRAAIALLDDGLDEPPRSSSESAEDAPTRGRLLRALALALDLVDDASASEVFVAARRQLEAEGNPREAALATAEHATWASRHRGRATAVDLMETAIALLPDRHAPGTAWLHFRRAHLALWLRRAVVVREANDDLVALAARTPETDDPMLTALAALVAAWAAQQDGRLDEAERAAREVVAAFTDDERRGRTEGIPWRAITVLCQVATALGDGPVLARHADAMIAWSRGTGPGHPLAGRNVLWRLRCLLHQHALDRGDLDGAMAQEDLVDGPPDLEDGIRVGLAELVAWRAWAAEDAGLLALAIRRRAHEADVRGVDVSDQLDLLRRAHRLLVRRSARPADASTEADAATDADASASASDARATSEAADDPGAPADRSRPPVPPSLVDLPVATLLVLGQDAFDRGDDVTLDAVLAWLDDQPPRTLPRVLGALVRAHAGVVSVDDLVAARDVAAARNLRRWVLAADLALVRLLPAEDEGAIATARRALTLATELRFPRSVDEAHAALRSAGQRVARSTGGAADDVLTPRQREITALVAEGLSNADVAARLFISVRTVTTHLDHIYTRLGVGSRTALAAWWHRDGAGDPAGT